MHIEIMDTTLRDGEQTSGVSFSSHEKLSLAKILLENVKIDRLEIASARVSDGEFESVKAITSWAKKKGLLDKIEVLGFVDGKVSVDWITKADGRVINLLAKGSQRHVELQLRKSPEQHLGEIKELITYADSQNVDVNIYLEDWSNGMTDSPDYVYFMVDGLKDTSIKRFMLPDTLGILNPDKAYEYCHAMVTRYPDLQFDFHAHNDYDLAAANVFSAIKAKIHGIHATVNGMGERAGNVPLSSVIGVIHDQLNLTTNIDEASINKASRIVETYSGVRIPANKACHRRLRFHPDSRHPRRW